MKTISIIWAWAAGLMSAAIILEEASRFLSSQEWRGQFRIHLFEKNTSPGKKVILSWGGRCNVTTGIIDKKILETKYTRGWEFIKNAFGKFSPKKCQEWFESHGVPLKCEENYRIFPVSDDGRDIVWVFEDIFEKYRDKVNIHYWEGVSGIDNGKDGNYSITTAKWVYESDILVITTGWNAYSQTGSTGDGYAFARSLWHTITELWPSLSSFLTDVSWLHELPGLVFESAGVSWYGHCEVRSNPENQKNRLPHSAPLHSQWQERRLSWPLLLTHFGISWPLAFMVSSHLAWEKIDKNHPKIIHFSPLSDMGFREWELFLKEEFQSHPKKLLTSILSEKLPRRFAEWFMQIYFSHILMTFAGSVSKVDRERISKLLGEGIPLSLLERRPGDEFVTAGWVSTDEIYPDTMESKIQKNLYFAGEILNVDGYTGGFSLQICWASGYVTGRDIVDKI